MSNQSSAAHSAAHDAYAPRTAPREQPEPKPKDTRSNSELRRDIDRVREELAQTLDALEYKLDVSARGREMIDAGRRRLSAAWDERPLVVAGAAAGAVAVATGAVVGIVALLRRNR